MKRKWCVVFIPVDVFGRRHGIGDRFRVNAVQRIDGQLYDNAMHI